MSTSPASSLRWRVLLVLALAAVVPAVTVGVLAVLHQPEAEAYALARRTTRDAAIVGGAALALALALGAFLATRLTRPLAALARRADAIAAGVGGPGVGAGGHGAPAAGPGEIGVLGHRLDEMARRIAERAELQAALARGDRLASVGVMAAQVAHELGDPLTTVLGHAKRLQEDRPAGHPDRAALEMIALEAERMKSIVGALLEYARTPRQGEPRAGAPARDAPAASCEIAAVFKHVGALVGPQLAKARVKLVAEPAAGPPVAIDTHALEQVLVHLIQRALQAMIGAGREGAIAIAARQAPGGVATVITVSDEGPSIPAADRGRIFDPFFTAGPAGVGTGLALAVCKHLIATAGGSITAGDREGGRGAELRLVIPNTERP